MLGALGQAIRVLDSIRYSFRVLDTKSLEFGKDECAVRPQRELQTSPDVKCH